MRTRVALVTGAGRGIGEHVARRVANHGYLVGIYDLEAPGWAIGDERFVPGVLDVTKPEDWERALSELTADFDGGLDLLVNNAGVLTGGPFIDDSYESDARIVDVNVKGVLYGCRAAYPYLDAADHSTVINLGSAAAIYGTPEMATYSASKFAVRGLTEALEQEWSDTDIRVVDVWPLYVNTGLLSGVETSGIRQLGVRLTPADVADIVADIATEFDYGEPGPWRLYNYLRYLFGRPVHRPVGSQATALYLASQITPGRLTRLFNSWLVG